MFFKNKVTAFIFLSCIFMQISAHDILIEAKGALFVPTNDAFKEIYHTCGDAGLELTGNLFDHLYGFVSADLIVKGGETVELNTYTKATIVNLAIGLKYFVPFNYGDFYIGLGIEPTYLYTFDDSPFVPNKNDIWSCGALAKVGLIVDLPHSFFTDMFFNYSFVESSFNSAVGSPTQSNNVFLNGCLFGVGLGYRFN